MLSLTRPLILASASPRRAALLRQIGLAFRVLPAHIDEPPPQPGEDVLAWARQAALDKARATAAICRDEQALILGADTVVVMRTTASDAPRLHGKPVAILGKPADAAEARTMLRALSGCAHQVISAFALLAIPEQSAVTEAVETRVQFRALSDVEIDAYLAGGEPLDKAGAYGIQGEGAVLVAGIEGDYYTVVGLPLARLWERLQPWQINPG